MALTGKLNRAGHTVRCVPLTGIVDLEPFPDPRYATDRAWLNQIQDTA